MKKEIGRLVLLTVSLVILKKFKPDPMKVTHIIIYAHLRELIIDLVLFGY